MEETPGFRPVPRTGVVYVMQQAALRGYLRGTTDWVNLGQGSPEVGPLEGAPPRRTHLDFDDSQHAYAPVDGIPELKERVAALYNHLYRQDKASQYTADNVCIAPGGRAAMTRVVAALGPIHLGHFLPDYTAYEELLFAFHGFVPIPILLDPAAGYRATADDLREKIVGLGLSALLASNPCNPTGHVTQGADLADWLALAREAHCTFILDEFYSHYIYGPDDGSGPHLVSAAEHVDDVNADPVVIVDGLTKNWRYPGWRIAWIVAPKDVIERVTSAGSFLDGGATHPFQRAAVDLLEPEAALAETTAIQAEFRRKRAYTLERLRDLDIGVDVEPDGAFYAWANLERLPEPLRGGHRFFEACLTERVITVPGVFFDVNPGKRRIAARYRTYTRISYGPPMEHLERGFDAVERVIARAR